MTHIMSTYGRIDLSFVKGEGPWLITKDKVKYLDFASGIAVNTLGHSHPKVLPRQFAQHEPFFRIFSYHVR